MIEATDGVHRRGRRGLRPAAGHHPAGADPDGGAVRPARRCWPGWPIGCPGSTLRVIEDQTERLLTGLREGSVDAALIALPAEASGITEIPIYDEDFVLALPPGHPLAGKRRVSPTALAELPLLLLDEGHCLRDQALDVCRNAGVRAELANTRAASLATAVQCVTGGLGVTLIPQSAVPVETARSRLELAYFAAPRPGRRIGLVFRSSSGREGPYRQLAGLIGELLAEDQQVRPAR